MEPSYTFNDFVSACKNGVGSVYVIKGAQETANIDFGLKTMASVIDFIGNNGLENTKFINTASWRNNPDKTTKVMVDEYEFTSGAKLGYLAFFFQPKTGQWNIKSFKANNQPDTRNFAFEKELKKLLEDKEGSADE